MQRLLLIYSLFTLILLPSSSGQSVILLNMEQYPEGSSIFLSQKKFNAEISGRSHGRSLRWSEASMTIRLEEKEAPLGVWLTFRAGRASHSVPLIIFPGDSITVHIDTEDYLPDTDIVFYRVEGPNAAGHQVLYEHMYYPPIYHMDGLAALLDNAPAETLFNDLQAEIARQLRPLDSLLAAGQIDKNYYELARGYVEIPLLSRAVSQLCGRANVEFDQLVVEDRQRITERLFRAYPPLDEKRLYSQYGIHYVTNYFLFERAKRLKTEHFFKLPADTVTLDGQPFVLTDAFPALLAVPDEELREYLFAHTLYSYYQIMVGDNQWIDEHTKFFYSLYPETKYREAIKWSQENSANVRHANSRRSPKAPKIPIGAGSHPLNNKIPLILDDIWELPLLAKGKGDRLSGKDLYIDIWASWCQPCREDMQYTDRTDSLLLAYGVERLYISIDELKDENSWVGLVLELPLPGYHVRAGKLLRQQLGTLLGYGSGPVLIPRYLWVKNGRVIERKAARPSEFQLLQSQLERYFADQ